MQSECISSCEFCCERGISSSTEGILLFILNREYSSIHFSATLTTNTTLRTQLDYTITHAPQTRQTHPTLLLQRIHHAIHLSLTHQYHLPTIVQHHCHSSLALQQLQRTTQLLQLTPLQHSHLVRHAQLTRQLVQHTHLSPLQRTQQRTQPTLVLQQRRLHVLALALHTYQRLPLLVLLLFLARSLLRQHTRSLFLLLELLPPLFVAFPLLLNTLLLARLPQLALILVLCLLLRSLLLLQRLRQRLLPLLRLFPLFLLSRVKRCVCEYCIRSLISSSMCEEWNGEETDGGDVVFVQNG